MKTSLIRQHPTVHYLTSAISKQFNNKTLDKQTYIHSFQELALLVTQGQRNTMGRAADTYNLYFQQLKWHLVQDL